MYLSWLARKDVRPLHHDDSNEVTWLSVVESFSCESNRCVGKRTDSSKGFLFRNNSVENILSQHCIISTRNVESSEIDLGIDSWKPVGETGTESIVFVEWMADVFRRSDEIRSKVSQSWCDQWTLTQSSLWTVHAITVVIHSWWTTVEVVLEIYRVLILETIQWNVQPTACIKLAT